MVNDKQICHKELMEEGSCERGRNNCYFSHDIPNTKKLDIEYKRKIRLQLHTNSLCVNEYRHQNSCRKKEMCTHRHVIEEHERSDPVIQNAMKEKWEKMTNRTAKQNKTSQNEMQNEESSLIKEATIVIEKLQRLLSSSSRSP